MPLLTPEVDSHGKADATLHFGSRPLTDSGTPHSDKQRAKERPAPPPLADPLHLALPLPRSTTPSSATSQNLLLGVMSDNSDFQNSFRTHAARHGIRIQNPDIPRAGRYGAAHGGTAGPGGDGQHRTPTTGLFAEEKTNSLTPQTIEE